MSSIPIGDTTEVQPMENRLTTNILQLIQSHYSALRSFRVENKYLPCHKWRIEQQQNSSFVTIYISIIVQIYLDLFTIFWYCFF